ncbi:hypothetical protein [Burkholderia territorii]|uniref:hypothetical protein n=1 Tax=Burkholderia territorii TaxID=1503055 RepID=UPI000B12502B|nr:hypothetical protein [Burkholderia territorii]
MKKSLFRFAIQTRSTRLSEVWSFIRHKKDACLFATRTSQHGWWKISFHESGQCHIKSYSDGSATKEQEWRHPDLGKNGSAHIMRIIYDINKQRGDFEFDRRVKLVFEEWGVGAGSVYLDVFFVLSDVPVAIDESSKIVAAHCLGGSKWVVFMIDVGPPQDELFEDLSGASMHIGEYVKDASGKLISLRNFTAMFYKVPRDAGALLVIEKADDNFSLQF